MREVTVNVVFVACLNHAHIKHINNAQATDSNACTAQTTYNAKVIAATRTRLQMFLLQWFRVNQTRRNRADAIVVLTALVAVQRHNWPFAGQPEQQDRDHGNDADNGGQTDGPPERSSQWDGHRHRLSSRVCRRGLYSLVVNTLAISKSNHFETSRLAWYVNRKNNGQHWITFQIHDTRESAFKTQPRDRLAEWVSLFYASVSFGRWTSTAAGAVEFSVCSLLGSLIKSCACGVNRALSVRSVIRCGWAKPASARFW